MQLKLNIYKKKKNLKINLFELNINHTPIHYSNTVQKSYYKIFSVNITQNKKKKN